MAKYMKKKYYINDVERRRGKSLESEALGTMKASGEEIRRNSPVMKK